MVDTAKGLLLGNREAMQQLQSRAGMATNGTADNSAEFSRAIERWETVLRVHQADGMLMFHHEMWPWQIWFLEMISNGLLHEWYFR